MTPTNSNPTQLSPSCDDLEEPLETSDSLAGFFETVAPQAKRFAMSITRRWCEAEEIVQESFFRMTRMESRDDSSITESSRKSYLFTTIRNISIDRIRQRQRRPVETRELDSIPGPQKRSGSDQERRLQKIEATVAASFQEMQPQWADALRLKINGELSYQEIADVLEATPDQVRGWIYRARKQLATELRREGLMDNPS